MLFCVNAFTEADLMPPVVSSVLGALVLVILLFDYLQKPSFLEITKSNYRVELNIYEPDSRYLFYLKESGIKTLTVADTKSIRCIQKVSKLPFLNQVYFEINEANDILRTQPINAAWLSDEDRLRLAELGT